VLGALLFGERNAKDERIASMRYRQTDFAQKTSTVASLSVWASLF
jgi:hypothetical protein